MGEAEFEGPGPPSGPPGLQSWGSLHPERAPARNLAQSCPQLGQGSEAEDRGAVTLAPEAVGVGGPGQPPGQAVCGAGSGGTHTLQEASVEPRPPGRF